MATAAELLMTTTKSATETIEDILVVDLNTRVIGIPASLQILGVESDDDVKSLQFRIPRHYGAFDLSTFDIRVNFENARRKGDVYPVTNITITDDDHIEFTWLVNRTAYEYSGDVKFSLCMKMYENDVVVKELNTTYATLPVLKGLETEKEVVEQNPSAFDQVMCRLYAVEAATGNGKNGYYSIVNVNQTDSGSVFTIVNQDGETIAYVRHGVDGYSPIKGVDYWTPEDEADIKQDVVEYTHQQVNAWAPRSASVVLGVDDWVDFQQVKDVEGVTADNIIIVAPEPSINNYREYSTRNVRCISQMDGKLVFECVTIPNADLTVNLSIYYSGNAVNTKPAMSVTDDDNGNVIFVG